MKRFVLILKICVLLVLLVAFILTGCTESSAYHTVNNVVVSKNTVMVGEEVQLSVKSAETGFLGCTKQRPDIEAEGSLFQWSVGPSNGATVKNGVFVAAKPGTYIVSAEDGPLIGKNSANVPATIVVQGTAAETTATETIAAETTAGETTTEPDVTTTTENETTTEEEITTEEETVASDTNLIHGVVPTKVTAHYSSKTDYGTITVVFEFWNIGKFGGEQYSSVTFTMYNPDNISLGTDEGYFTGGPNGEIHMNWTTYKSQSNDFQLQDGKMITTAGGNATIDNPEAFKGWVD
jgi:hypothetical protein